MSIKNIDKNNFLVVAGGVDSAQGFRAGGVHCGLRKTKKDLGWIVSDRPASAAAVYTCNKFQAAPLKVTQQSLTDGCLQALVVNSGNANSFTGDLGLSDAKQMKQQFAQVHGLAVDDVAVLSTGVIGEMLPMDKIAAGITQSVDYGPPNGEHFAEAIMTTDTATKQVAVEVTIEGKKVVIGGAAKGSGMIKPNMATMLGFITTDANVNSENLQQMLRDVTNSTFNMITVDGDTSTNDTVLVMANGAAGTSELTADHPEWSKFKIAMEYVCQELAKMIARDGEGATKLIEVKVFGAKSTQDAESAAKSVVGSSLVKAAVFGADPNWGRIACAVGYSGIEVAEEQLSVAIGNFPVLKLGYPLPSDEEALRDYLEQENIVITIDLNQGAASAKAWGCDLSYDYVRINASYRT